MSFLNKKIFSFKKSAFGLDLSDLSIKVVQLNDDRNEKKVLSFGRIQLPPGVIVDGEIIDEEKVSQAIKKILKTAGPKKIKNKRVVCSVPETKAFLRIITLPKMSDKEVKEAIKWEIEANIPLPLDQVYFDWQILEKKLTKDENKLCILVVAVSRTTANKTLETLETSGLEVMGLEVESVAQARSLFKEEGDNLTKLVIDFGDRRTSFFILIDNFPCFTSSIPISCQTLTDAIAKSLNLTTEEAEKIKLQYGIGSFASRDVLFKAMEPVLENLVSEIGKSIDFYLNDLSYSTDIDKIIICGGGANAKGIIPYLSKKLGRTVEMGNPWVNFPPSGKLPKIERDKSVEYSTAIGLAIKGMDI
jgi:type IV pilus assembly protein PilM